jgi:predicted cupin superfamily sugar epimerase
MTHDETLTAAEVIRLLDLTPHPEGGHFREVFRDGADDGGRGAVTSIHFLLADGEISHWHRVDAVEIWCHQAGGPLELATAPTESGPIQRLRLGSDLAAGEQLQAVVQKSQWQSARPLAAWTLVGCAVAPAFVFEGFELAPSGWQPKG